MKCTTKHPKSTSKQLFKLSDEEKQVLLTNLAKFLGRELDENERFFARASAQSILDQYQRLIECFEGTSVMLPRFTPPHRIGGDVAMAEPQFIGLKGHEEQFHSRERKAYEASFLLFGYHEWSPATAGYDEFLKLARD